MAKPYKYRLRPCYGSNELLLEFLLDDSDTEFEKDFFFAIKEIHPNVDSVNDLWMNDEVLLQVSSDQGAFLFSKDVWNFAFITAEKNQQCIKLLDNILTKSSLFEKEAVDFEDYKNLKT